VYSRIAGGITLILYLATLTPCRTLATNHVVASTRIDDTGKCSRSGVSFRSNALRTAAEDALMQTNTTRHLLLAAKSGNAAAQFNLGVLCQNRLDDNGYPIKGNRAAAMKWLLAAAEQGLPRAQSKLAEMYADGPAGAEDDINACIWFLLATMSLAGIHRHRAQSGYKRVSSRLTAAQLAKARCLALDWKPSRNNKAGKFSGGASE
jgi:TPR repeat protein